MNIKTSFMLRIFSGQSFLITLSVSANVAPVMFLMGGRVKSPSCSNHSNGFPSFVKHMSHSIQSIKEALDLISPVMLLGGDSPIAVLWEIIFGLMGHLYKELLFF